VSRDDGADAAYRREPALFSTDVTASGRRPSGTHLPPPTRRSPISGIFALSLLGLARALEPPGAVCHHSSYGTHHHCAATRLHDHGDDLVGMLLSARDADTGRRHDRSAGAGDEVKTLLLAGCRVNRESVELDLLPGAGVERIRVEGRSAPGRGRLGARRARARHERPCPIFPLYTDGRRRSLRLYPRCGS